MPWMVLRTTEIQRGFGNQRSLTWFLKTIDIPWGLRTTYVLLDLRTTFALCSLHYHWRRFDTWARRGFENYCYRWWFRKPQAPYLISKTTDVVGGFENHRCPTWFGKPLMSLLVLRTTVALSTTIVGYRIMALTYNCLLYTSDAADE